MPTNHYYTECDRLIATIPPVRMLRCKLTNYFSWKIGFGEFSFPLLNKEGNIRLTRGAYIRLVSHRIGEDAYSWVSVTQKRYRLGFARTKLQVWSTILEMVGDRPWDSGDLYGDGVWPSCWYWLTILGILVIFLGMVVTVLWINGDHSSSISYLTVYCFLVAKQLKKQSCVCVHLSQIFLWINWTNKINSSHWEKSKIDKIK